VPVDSARLDSLTPRRADHLHHHAPVTLSDSAHNLGS